MLDQSSIEIYIFTISGDISKIPHRETFERESEREDNRRESIGNGETYYNY